MRKIMLMAMVAMSVTLASAVGNWIVYTSKLTGQPIQIYMMNDDGTNNQQVTMVDANNQRPYISKNATGNLIVYDSDRDTNNELYLMSDNGDKEVRLTNDPGADMDPTISADLATIIYVHSSGGKKNQLYKMTYLGIDPFNAANWSAPVDISNDTTIAEEAPAISRDGKTIAYICSPSGTASAIEIWTMDLNGNNKQKITNNLFPDKHPDFSPDGKFIVYYSTRVAGDDIFLYDIANKQEYQVTFTGDNRYPAFSIDGKSIAFSSKRFGNNYEICMVDISDLTNLANATVVRVTNTDPTTDNIDPTLLPGMRPPTPPVITAPVQKSPANTSTNNAFSLDILWNPVTIATRYNMQVATDNQFVSIVYQTSQTPQPFSLTTANITGLSPSTTYYWRVQAGDQFRWGLYSSIWSFTTKAPDLVVPVLVSPANTATGVSLPARLIWNAVNRATNYDIQVAADNLFTTTSIVYSQTGTTILNTYVPGLLNNTQYFWRARATNSTAQSAYSSSSSFNTGAVSLAAPTLISPVANQQSVSITPKLSWTAVVNAISYQYELYTASDLTGTPVTGNSNSTSATFITNSLQRSTTYYWRVRALGAGGAQGAWSKTGVFTTILGPPTLLLPANAGTVSSPVTFTWAAYPLATKFIVNISVTNTFTNVIRYTTTTNSLPNVVLNNGIYYWRVQAVNAVSTSDWSASSSFTVNTTAKHQPNLMIKALNDFVYQGTTDYYQGAYDPTKPNNQTASTAVPYRKIATFLINLRNDGNATESFLIELKPVGIYDNWKFHLLLNNSDLTTRATNGGYLIENVKPTTSGKTGDTVLLRLEASPYSTTLKTTTVDPFTIDIVATAFSSGTVIDVVRAVVGLKSESRIK